MADLVRRVGGEFGVNTVTQGLQSDPDVARLPDGRFVVVWTDGSQIGTDWDGSAIKAQIFDSDGTRIGGEITVNAFVRGGQTSPSVMALRDGSFVVSWTTDRPDPADGGDGSGSAVKGRLFDRDGNPLGGEFAINGEAAFDQGFPSVYGSISAAFFVTWQSYTSSGEADVKIRRFDSSGVGIGPENHVTQASGPQVEPAGAGLYPGLDVVVWTDGNSGGGDIKATFISTQGQGTGRPIGPEFLVNSVVEGAQGQPDVAAFADGGFVVVWASLEGDIVRARAQVFGPDNLRAGPEILLSKDGHSIFSPAVIALDGGGFFIAWGDRDLTVSPPGGAAVLGQYFGPDGEKLGSVSLLGNEADPSGTIDLAALDDGRFAAVWTDGAGDVSGQVLKAPVLGTDGQDRLSGGPGDDALVGGGGDDVLSGEGGDDALHGEEGSDDLFGGDGEDSLFGGEGNDILRGGPGVDSFDGGGEEDFFDWDRGYGDRISFFEERATQGVVADLRTGVISNDGFGNVETMTDIESLGAGTAYSDTLYGDDSSNWLVAGPDDHLYGFGGNDILMVRGAAATMDGGDGLDTLRFVSYFSGYRPDEDGDGVAEREPSLTEGYTADLMAGTLRDGDGNTGFISGIENLAGSYLDDNLRGNGGPNTLRGDAGNDVFQLQDGGVDLARGDRGNDIFFFIGALTEEDRVDGSDDPDGIDTLVLQGDYGAGLILTANVSEIERIALLAGSNTRFGEPGTNRYDYVLTTHDSNFARGVQARINGSSLLADEDLTFDGSAETDANFEIYGGKGKDSLTGGLRNDIFFFDEERLAPGDSVDGGAGYDGLFLRGNYTIDFDAPGYAGLLTDIENLTLTSATDARYGRGGTAFDYDLTLSDAFVDAGQTLTVSGSLLLASETMVLDASREADGLLRLFGGRAADTLKGGGQNDLIHGNLGADILAGNGGADAFRYQDVAESSSGSRDHILDFTPGTDKIELDRIDANAGLEGNQAFSWIGSNAFSGSAGQLRAYEQNGTWFVEGDTDGDSIADLVIALTLQGAAPLGAGDFLL